MMNIILLAESHNNDFMSSQKLFNNEILVHS